MAMPGSFAESVTTGQIIDPGEMARTEKLYEEILTETDSAPAGRAFGGRLCGIATETLRRRRNQAQEIGERS